MLLIDHRENKKLIHQLIIKMGDEAKEINDLYRSILGIGRSRTIVAQLKDLCEKFEKPFLVVYNTELKPYFHGRKPTAQEIAKEKSRMKAVIKSFKMTMHHRFPNLHFLQLTTMNDFVEWLYTNHRQNVISAIKPPKEHLPEQVIDAQDDRVKALMFCGVSKEQAESLLLKYGNITNLLRKSTKQKDMMLCAGIDRKQAKRILALAKDFN
jgi:ERCC4-type nuclease